jgi:predicted Zn-dependent protease
VLDLATAQYKFSLLLADYPFDQHQQVQPPTVSDFTQTFFQQFPAMPATLQQLASAQMQGGDWLKLHQQLLAYYQQQRDALNAAKVAALLSDALPFKADIAFAAGQLYFAASDPALARYYQWRAVQLQPEGLQFRMMLARSMAAAGDLVAALAQLDVVLKQQPNQPIALQQQARLQAALAANPGGIRPRANP